MLQRKFALIKRKLDTYSIGDLTDVSIGTPTNGQTLIWNGSAFVPGDHGDIAGLADDDHTQYAGIAQSETITGAWTLPGTTTIDGITATNLVEKSATETISGAWTFGGGAEIDTYGAVFATGASQDLSFWFYNSDWGTNDKYWAAYASTNGQTFGLLAYTDALSAKWAWQAVKSGGALTGITYGNSTDNPTHQFHGEVRLGTDQPLRFDEHSSAAGTPASGNVYLYAKADGLLYSKDDAGTETLVSGGSGGSANFDDILTAGGEVLVDGSGNVLTI